MKVLIYSSKDFEIPFLIEGNSNKHKLTFLSDALSSETAIKSIGYQAISIFSADNASVIVLEKLKDFGVKYITLRSVGHDNVNLKAALRFGLRVANVPAYSPFAIAEHAVCLLLAINRKLIISNQRVKRFNFDLNNLIGFDLKGKTIGIIGTGTIGAVMVRIMHGFGCKIVAFDIVENKELIQQYNIKYLPLQDLCKQSNIISLHVPLNGNTHHLIDKKLIEQMKPDVTIINTARGSILNTKDIIEGLRNKTIGGLGMDVYENEKGVFFKDHSIEIPKDELLIQLNAMPNVLITGHHAFLTEEALTKIAETTIYNLDCWDKNKETENELTFVNKVIQ
jgi:D-lactate dehydrogenase